MKKERLTETLTVDNAERLDKFLHRHIGGSRNQIEQLIKKGLVQVNEKVVKKAGYKVVPGEKVEYTIPEEPSYEAESVDFDVPIIYEDEEILVLNKPSGLVVHPAPSVKTPTLVDWLKAKGVNLSTISGEERHGIVHRLDKETSGAMVVAKNNASHEKLSDQLQNRSMGRYYVALIDYPLKESGVVEAPIGRNPANRLKMGVVKGGRAAKTRFEKLLVSEKNRYELIGAKLYTGRTHQIRVHLASLNRHIVGDSLYGFKSRNDKIKRILLHAYILYLDHPKTGKTMQFVAPIPYDMRERLESCFEKEQLDEILDPCNFLRRFGDHCDRLFFEDHDTGGAEGSG
ncbi:RluA family pseudouridine synthase [Hydrogenimonas sp.]|uniref:RluA family pseudouridine synthase n=1 Tax=Hydrogenimonas sp. TaxID=2231112 RepID=UPI00261CAC82|nr:RluA family pseudouridine synthase [Hydrogenimonas sp.]